MLERGNGLSLFGLQKPVERGSGLNPKPKGEKAMKRILRSRMLILVLAVAVCGAMTPGVMYASSQATTTTSTSASSKASKRKARKEAKKARKEAAKAAKEQKTETSSSADAKSHHWMHHETTASSSKAEANTHETASTHPPSSGMVWVNTSSKVYHKAGSKWAGKTKHGKWMSEQEAVKDGYKAAKN